MENYPGGTSKLTVAVFMVVIIAAAGFTYAITSGIMPIFPVSPPTSSIPTNTSPIQGIDTELNIDGDGQMLVYVEENGLYGSGTHSDPYIIENLSIVSTRTCISIMNVEASFVIRNCQLQVTTLDYWGICIYIGKCVDASVINCRTEGGLSGIEFFESHDSLISDCDVRYSGFGVNISGSQSVRIENNLIYNNTWGVTFTGSDLTTVIQNEIGYCDFGIISQFSFRCMIEENLITGNNYGVQVEGGCENWTISANDILYNSEIGIRFDDTVSRMIVYKNRLGWNTVNNSLDDGTDNLWDYENGFGNSWHDYSGVGWYIIPGNAGSVDHFPQLLEG